jgi:hypothetical protein
MTVLQLMLCPEAVGMSVLKAVLVKKWDGERGHACEDSSGIIVSRLAEDVFLCVSSQVTMLFFSPFFCFFVFPSPFFHYCHFLRLICIRLPSVSVVVIILVSICLVSGSKSSCVVVMI